MHLGDFMFTPAAPWAAVLLPPAMGYADREIGKDAAGDPNHRSHGMFVALGVGGVAAVLSLTLAGLIMVLAWMIYRSITFSGGASVPTTNAQRVTAILRHVWLVPAGLLVAFFMHQPVVLVGLCMVAYWIVASGLAIWYGERDLQAVKAGVAIGNENATVETVRGAAYGLALLAWALLQRRYA